MFPDLFNATFKGERASDQVDLGWYENEYLPKVGKRGAEIIEARGASSAASAANAAIDHMHDWIQGPTPPDGLVSMAVSSHGEYGVPEGLISSFPVRVSAVTTRSPRASRSARSRSRRSTSRSPSSRASAMR